MITPFGLMYLRPGNLWTEFEVKRSVTRNENGFPVTETVGLGRLFGILAEASTNDSDRTKNRWDQEQHSLTHTLVIRGKADVCKGDHLISQEKGFLVLLYEDIGALGASGLIYLEERNDIK